MSGGWSLVAYYLLPPPVIMMTLLVLPLPKLINRGVNKFLLSGVDKFMRIPVISSLQMVHLMIIITGVTFLATVSDTIKYHKVPIPEIATPGQKIGILASRWRAERNFWIAFISLFTWGILMRFSQIKRQLLDAEKDKADLQKEVEQYAAELARRGTPSAPPVPSAPSNMVPLEVELPEPKKDK